MKFWAVLKDSLREAIDNKVFYFLAALSCLLILLVGSLSFRPVTVREEAQRFADTLNWAFGLNPQTRGARLVVEDFSESDAPEPWDRRYNFTLVVRASNPDEVRLVRQSGQFSGVQMAQLLRQAFAWLSGVQASEVPTQDPAEVSRAHFSSNGSKVKQLRDWPHAPGLFFGAVSLAWVFTGPVGAQVQFIEDFLVGSVGIGVAMLVSTLVTAFFIPNMLRKGSVDLLLAKPIRRPTLLLYKFLGGLLFMFLNTVLVVGGVWLALTWRSGLWAPGFLLTIFVFTFEFAIFYAVSTLFAVLTRSPIIAILMACCTWVVLFVVGMGYRYVDQTRDLTVRFEEAGVSVPADVPSGAAGAGPPGEQLPAWAYRASDAIHYVLPRLKDLDALCTALVARDLLPPDSAARKRAEKNYSRISWGESVGVSAAFIALMLGLACWRFASKDY